MSNSADAITDAIGTIPSEWMKYEPYEFLYDGFTI